RDRRLPLPERRTMSQRFDRRHFLLGAGGAMLAIPVLESLAPRRAFAQTSAPPKRLLIVMNQHGRCIGDDGDLDLWSPSATSGSYATPGGTSGIALSRQLQDLAPVADKIVTFDGIDNLVRHATGNSDGHSSPIRTTFTCVLPNG